MVDVSALNQIFSIESAAWTAVAIMFLFVVRLWNGSPAMFAQWIEYRKTRAAEKAADWSRLRDEIARADERYTKLEERADRSEESHRLCEEQLLDKERRLATLEGYQIGRGQLRQEVTIIESTERLEEDDKRAKSDG